MVSMATAVPGWRVNDESLLMRDDEQSYGASAADEALFCQLPNELIRQHVYSFFDIQSLNCTIEHFQR